MVSHRSAGDGAAPGKGREVGARLPRGHRVYQGCWAPALGMRPGRVEQGWLLGKWRAVMLEQVPRQLLMLQGAKGPGLHTQSKHLNESHKKI